MNRAAITDTASAKAQRLESVATRVPRQYGHHGVYDDWRDRGLGSLGSGGLLGLPNDVLGRIEGYVDPRPKGPRPPAVEVPIGTVYDQRAVGGIYTDWNYAIPPRDRPFRTATADFDNRLTTLLIQTQRTHGDQWLQRANEIWQWDATENWLHYEQGRRNLQVM